MKNKVNYKSNSDYKLRFGKYRGYSLSDVFYKDKDYLFWLVDNSNKDKDIKEKVMLYLGYPKEIISSL